MAEPEVPELKPRFEFRFSGPAAPVEPSRLRRLARHSEPQSVSDAADQWSGYRYARPEDEYQDEYQDSYADYGQSYESQQYGDQQYRDQGYEEQPYQEQPYGDQRYDEQPHEGRQYTRSYAAQPYDAEPYQAESYDAQPYDEQPYRPQSYEPQSYEPQSYSAQPYDGEGYDDVEYDSYGEPRRYPAVSHDFWAAQQAGYAADDGEAAGEGSQLAKSLLSRARAMGTAARRPGSASHRLPAPPAALKGRAAVLAVAAGAVVAAGQSAFAGTGTATNTSDTADAAAATSAMAAPGSGQAASMTAQAGSPQVVDIVQPTDRTQFTDVFNNGKQLAKDRAAREAAEDRPLFVLPVRGAIFTSGFGVRWGAMHSGVDMAAPIGTPIYAVEDGTVISAGPASGFGMWVRLQHPDGTITVYGHVNTATVSVGQHVEAGDQIATVGNRGYSTGPHCHFEVWKNGVTKIDPLPWLASRGISLGPEED